MHTYISTGRTDVRLRDGGGVSGGGESVVGVGCWVDGKGVVCTSEQRRDRSSQRDTSHDDNPSVYFTHIIDHIYTVSIFDKILNVY
jgi:hypothetical protein